MQATLNTNTPYVPHCLLMLVLAVSIHGALIMLYGMLTPQERSVTQGQKDIVVGLKLVSLPSKVIASPPEVKVATQKNVTPKPIKPVQKVVRHKPKPLINPAPIINPEPLAVAETIDAEPIDELMVEEPVVEEKIAEVRTTVASSSEAEAVNREPVTKGNIDLDDNVDSEDNVHKPQQFAVGSSNSAMQKNYETTLLHWLEKHKRYPSTAKRRGQQDIVELSFSIDAQGNLLSYEIVNASAFKSLNKAVEKMIKRASPLPAVPAELANYQAQFSYVVPVQFELR